jgi:putative phosphoserine phosphatase/1-acylglycerol-3-phosphate O-acyltransferase
MALSIRDNSHSNAIFHTYHQGWQEICNAVDNRHSHLLEEDIEMTSLEQHLRSIDESTAVRAPAVVFFDLDRTLIAGYSILAMAGETARHAARQGEVRQAGRVFRDLLRHRVENSGSNYHRVVRRVTNALQGVPEAVLQELGEEAYRKRIEKTLYSEAITLVEAHRAAGHRLVIVSAASRYQVEPVARVLGIEEFCCTRLEVQEGRFTGRLVAPLCYGEGKTLAARGVARRNRVKLENCWFYSDSSADLPLLKAVGHPVAVNASDKLGVYARANGWPQLQFHTRGFPGVESVTRTLLTGQTLLATRAIGLLGRRLGVGENRNINRMTQLLGDVGAGVAGLEFEIEGRENLYRHRPAVFVFNHQSLLDSLVLAHLLRKDVVAFCKKEMASNPLIGPLLRQLDTVFVDREEKNQSALMQQALAVLASGRSLVIAPEGTRSVLGEIQPFKHGAFYLARKAGVPLVPIVLHNVKDALPKGALLLRPATIRVTVLPPVQPDTISSVRGACSTLEDRYIELLGKSRHAALPHRAIA